MRNLSLGLGVVGFKRSLVRFRSFICLTNFRSYIFCNACITRCPFATCSMVFSEVGSGVRFSPSSLRQERDMLRAVIMCFLRMWLITISKGSPLGQGYFSRISGMRPLSLLWGLPWKKSCLLGALGRLSTLWEASLLGFPAFSPCRSLPPMTVLKKETISSFCPSSFWIMERNSPNSIFPDLSSSTESMRALISQRVSKSPTEKRSSSSSSMPMEPVFLSSRELKHCFISRRSSLSKSIRYFFPFLVSHFRSWNCFRQFSWSSTSSARRRPSARPSTPFPSLARSTIISLTRAFSMSLVSSANASSSALIQSNNRKQAEGGGRTDLVSEYQMFQLLLPRIGLQQLVR